MRALRQLYFPGRRASRKRLEKFTAAHFGNFAGYAQQYLFHYMRTNAKSREVTSSKSENVELPKTGYA
jgi:N-glycosylase/DNA lyase